MFRRILAAALLFSVFPILQAQTRSHGLPASVNSPTATPDGQSVANGLPASVNSPTPIGRFSTLPRHDHRLFDARRHHNQRFAVPVFYPIYSSPFYDPTLMLEREAAPEPDTGYADLETVRRAYLQGVHDAMTVQEERTRAAAPRAPDRKQTTQEAEPSNITESTTRVARQPRRTDQEEPPAEEPGAYDPTVFIFKDGHQVESNNFVIVGKVLMDFSHKPMKKISLAELDTDATRKANDERGTSLRLP